jgi:adenylate cyclase class 2
MLIENEIKYKIDNLEKMKDKAISCGFKFVGSKYQEDYYYSPPHKNFSKSRKFYLRIRKIGKKGKLEYHIVKNNIETLEWGVMADNFKELSRILKFLDFRLLCVVKKKRMTFKQGKMTVVLDKVKNLGNFIEIEYCGKRTKKLKNIFDSILSMLQIKRANKVSGLGYPDLLMK